MTVVGMATTKHRRKVSPHLDEWEWNGNGTVCVCVCAYICIEQNELIMREECMLHSELYKIRRRMSSRRRKKGRRRGREREGLGEQEEG